MFAVLMKVAYTNYQYAKWQYFPNFVDAMKCAKQAQDDYYGKIAIFHLDEIDNEVVLEPVIEILNKEIKLSQSLTA